MIPAINVRGGWSFNGIVKIDSGRYHASMAQLLVRNLSNRTVLVLKERAARHGRSIEAEHRAILDEALVFDELSFSEQADIVRAKTSGRSLVPSWVLIREDRDGR